MRPNSSSPAVPLEYPSTLRIEDNFGVVLMPNSFCVSDLPWEASEALDGVDVDEGETTVVPLVRDSDLLPVPLYGRVEVTKSSLPRLLSREALSYAPE